VDDSLIVPAQLAPTAMASASLPKEVVMPPGGFFP